MSFQVFFCGHGSYTPDNGTFTVPKGCRVVFYGHFMKTVVANQTEEVIRGTSQAEPHEVFEAFRSCPNMTLHHQSNDDIINRKHNARLQNPDRDSIAIHLLGAGQTQTLKQYVETSADLIRDRVRKYGSVDLIWACCRSVKFKGRHMKLADEIGANAIDLFADQEYKLRYKRRGRQSQVTTDDEIGGEIGRKGY